MPVRWLKRLWGGDAPPAAPILLRVVEPTGECARSLSVDLCWAPSGRRVHRDLIPSDGLCMLHWLSTEKQVSIVVRSAIGRNEVTVVRAQNDGAVIALSLVRELPVPMPAPDVARPSNVAGRRGR